MTLSTSTVTLAPGSSRTYTLAPGEAVTVATEPNCYVTVTETPDVITTADLDGQTNVRTSILQYKGEWTYGPYALGGTVVVDVSSTKSTSSVSATLGSSAAAVVGAAISRTGDGPPQFILPSETVSLVSTFAWSSLPAAADYIGVAYVSDVGPHGSYWQSDGAAWGLVGGSCILASSAVASSSLTGSVSETTMASIAIPANLLGPNGALDIETKWSTNNDASSKTWYARFDSTLVTPGVGLASGLSSGSRATIQNRNSASSQIGGNGGVSGYAPQSSAWTTSTFNTATAFALNIRAALSDAADTMTLEAYRVTLIRP